MIILFIAIQIIWISVLARIFLQSHEILDPVPTRIIDPTSPIHVKLRHMVIPSRLTNSSSSLLRWDYHGLGRVWRNLGHVSRISHGASFVHRQPGIPRFSSTSAPNITDKETLLILANMAFDSYIDDPTSKDWHPVHDYSPTGFGWNESSLRGYVFVASHTDQDEDDNKDNDKNKNNTSVDDPPLIIISIKGSTLNFDRFLPLSLADHPPSTVDDDKTMDNLFFSCCCAKVDPTWRPICECPLENTTHHCQSTCLHSHLRESTTYYHLLMDIYRHIMESMYPSTRVVWFIGHSLGGALASLMSLSTGWPAVTFESPGEKLAAIRLGIPINETDLSRYLIHHVGNAEDPVFLGTCRGPTSPCYYAGYALETQCHVGQVLMYNQSSSSSSSIDLVNHRLAHLIEQFIRPNPVPEPQFQSNCVDCPEWTFVD
jgi:lipase ATG15